MKILLFHGKGIISWLIRLQTRGVYSHAAIMLDDGSIVEAWQGKGVQKLTGLADGTVGVDAFELKEPIKAGVVEDFLNAVLADNDGYDYWAVLRFITRRSGKKNNKWFCSELVFEAILAGGVELFARTEGWEVSPALIAKSPLLNFTTCYEEINR